MADSDVSVRRHHGEEDGAGELVDARGSQVDLAHDRAEDPVSFGRRHHEEGNAHQKALVGQRQVQNVQVRHRLHLGVPEHHVDDQSVATKPHHAHQGVEDLDDRHEGHRQLRAGLAAQTPVPRQRGDIEQSLIIDVILTGEVKDVAGLSRQRHDDRSLLLSLFVP